MISISDVRVRSFELDFMDVYFDVSPTFEDLADYQFVVQRADSQFGEYVNLTVPFRNRFHVRDNTVRGQYSFYDKLYYRVKVTNTSTGDEAFFPELGGVCLSAKPDLIALEMARMNNLRLKEFSGRVVYVFPKMRSGQRCSNCYDRVAQRKVRSQCGTCYDTTWVGGYTAPVQTYAMVIVPNETTTHSDFANIEVENSMIMLGNYPEVREGDLIVEAENVRWRVGSTITKVQKQRALIRQQAQIHRIPKGDMEYRVPLNLSDDEVRDLIATPLRNYSNPQTLEGVDLATALNIAFGNT